MADEHRQIQIAMMRDTLVALYGEEHVRRLERAQRPPANDMEPATPENLQRIRDEQEAARFAAELKRDAVLGSHADWYEQ